MNDLLTPVSKDDDVPDVVLLELEANQAWEAMRHHEQLASALKRELALEAQYRERLKIKAQGFDRLTHLIKAQEVAWQDLADVVKAVTNRFDILNEIQRASDDK